MSEKQTEQTRKALYEKAIRFWGINFQIAMMAEEAAELAVASLHLNRLSKAHNLPAFVEEIADVEIMIEQMVLYYNCRPFLEEIKQQKIMKLVKRLEGI